jgi:hypothetical protein
VAEDKDEGLDELATILYKARSMRRMSNGAKRNEQP